MGGGPEAVTMNCIVWSPNLFPTAVSQDRFMSRGPGRRRGARPHRARDVGPRQARADHARPVDERQLQRRGSSRCATSWASPTRAEEACFRLEFLGEECWVDNVLVEVNAAQLGFFDGDWHTGMQATSAGTALGATRGPSGPAPRTL